MRCNRLNATFSTAICLRRQSEMIKSTGDAHMGFKPGIGHQCFKCEQGAEIKKKGVKGMDQDVEKLKEEQPQGFQPPLMRTCQECKAEKGVSQFHGNNQVCRKCLINKTRARMKEANKPELLKQLAEVGEGAPPITQFEPDPAHYIEAGGLRIQLCQRCLKRFLGVGKGRITLTAGRKRGVVIMP